jgi:hypothetical protein
MPDEIKVEVIIPETENEAAPVEIIETPSEMSGPDLAELVELRAFKADVEAERIAEAERVAENARLTAEAALNVAIENAEQIQEATEEIEEAPIEEIEIESGHDLPPEPDKAPGNTHSWFKNWFK